MLNLQPRQVCRFAVAMCAFFSLASVVGCGKGKQQTAYPVTGKVVYKATGEAVPRLSGGYVCLESVTDPNNKPVGEIEDEGVFFLGTVVDGKNLGGVLPGEYRVRVVLPDDPAVNRLARKMIDSRFASFDKSGLRLTVAAGKNEDVKIEVERPK